MGYHGGFEIIVRLHPAASRIAIVQLRFVSRRGQSLFLALSPELFLKASTAQSRIIKTAAWTTAASVCWRA
jgi:hypothetical protein